MRHADGQDRERINVHQDYELRDWSKSLSVTPERLKEAVQAVGDRTEEVGEYLKGNKSDKPSKSAKSSQGRRQAAV